MTQLPPIAYLAQRSVLTHQRTPMFAYLSSVGDIKFHQGDPFHVERRGHEIPQQPSQSQIPMDQHRGTEQNDTEEQLRQDLAAKGTPQPPPPCDL